MSTPENNGIRIPTAEEVAALDLKTRAEFAAAYLSGLEPGRQPLSLFTQMARLAVTSTVEFIPFKQTEEDENPQVLLTQRPPSNDWWSNKWHVPGVVLLASDEGNDHHGYEGPINRLLNVEMGGALALTGEPQILRGRFAHGVRGSESTLIHWGEVTVVDEDKLPRNARFFDAEQVLQQPPEGGFITYHDVQVADATAAFTAYRQR